MAPGDILFTCGRAAAIGLLDSDLLVVNEDDEDGVLDGVMAVVRGWNQLQQPHCPQVRLLGIHTHL